MSTQRSTSAECGVMAAIGIVLVAVCAALLWSAIGVSADPHGNIDQGRAHHQKGSQDYCNAKLRALGYEPSTDGGGAIDPDGKKHQENLCLQIRSAEAAEEAAVSAWWQWVIASFSLGLVFVATIAASLAACFTWKQADIASKAIGHAKAGADAAARSVDVHIRMEQPVLWLKQIKVAFDAPAWKMIECELTNFGKTPAIVTEHSTSTCKVEDAGNNPTYGHYMTFRGRLANPGETLPIYNDLMSDDIATIVSAGGAIVLYGCCRYEDIFGRRRHWGFGFLGETSPYLTTATGFMTYSWSRFGGDAYNYDKPDGHDHD